MCPWPFALLRLSLTVLCDHISTNFDVFRTVLLYQVWSLHVLPRKCYEHYAALWPCPLTFFLPQTCQFHVILATIFSILCFLDLLVLCGKHWTDSETDRRTTICDAVSHREGLIKVTVVVFFFIVFYSSVLFAAHNSKLTALESMWMDLIHFSSPDLHLQCSHCVTWVPDHMVIGS